MVKKDIKKAFLEKLPILKTSDEQQKPFENLVDKIIKRKQQGKDTKDLEDKIDKMVYKLYGLSEDEIKIIEEQK